MGDPGKVAEYQAAVAEATRTKATADTTAKTAADAVKPAADAKAAAADAVAAIAAAPQEVANKALNDAKAVDPALAAIITKAPNAAVLSQAVVLTGKAVTEAELALTNAGLVEAKGADEIAAKTAGIAACKVSLADANQSAGNANTAATAAGITPVQAAFLATLVTPVVDTTKAVALQTERDAQVGKLQKLQETGAGSKLHEELTSIERLTSAHKEKNLHRMRSMSFDKFGEFELVLATKLTAEQQEQKKLSEADPNFHIRGLNQLVELETGVHKKKNGKANDYMVSYDADTHQACPIPNPGRATGFSWLDGDFKKAWGDTFDLLAHFSTITLSIEPDKENLSSLKTMVELVIARDRYVKLDSDALKLVADHMSPKEAQKFLAMIQQKNDALAGKNLLKDSETVKADAKAAQVAAREPGLMQDIDRRAAEVSAMRDAINAGPVTADMVTSMVTSIHELADLINELGESLEAKPAQSLENHVGVERLKTASDTLNSAVGVVQAKAAAGTVTLSPEDAGLVAEAAKVADIGTKVALGAEAKVQDEAKKSGPSPLSLS